MVIITITGSVTYGNGNPAAGGYVAHVCGYTCPYWNPNDPLIRVMVQNSGFYSFQFEAGPVGAMHYIAASAPPENNVPVSRNVLVEVGQINGNTIAVPDKVNFTL